MGGSEPTREYGAPWLPLRCPGDCLCSSCSGVQDMLNDRYHEARAELGPEDLDEAEWS